MFSRRSAFDSEPNALSAASSHLRESGTAVLDLTLSNPTAADLPQPALPALDRPGIERYAPEPFGLASARSAVAAWMSQEHGVTVAPERIVLTASTSEAYGFLFKLLCDAGDRVLVPRPSYPLLEHLATLENVQLTPYPLAYDGVFHIDTSALQASARQTQGLRAVITVSPNNPTGSYVSRDELRVMSELGAPLISDEVFSPYRLDAPADRCTCALVQTEGLVFTLHGLSKLGLPQLKLSWLCVGGPPPLVGAALERLELIADTYLSVGTPVQLALPELLRAQEPLMKAIRTRIRENLEQLKTRLAGSAVTVLRVEGGWSAVLRMPATESDEQWALGLLREQRVMTQPGYFYDFEQPACLVVSLVPRPDVFAEGIARLCAHVERRISA